MAAVRTASTSSPTKWTRFIDASPRRYADQVKSSPRIAIRGLCDRATLPIMIPDPRSRRTGGPPLPRRSALYRPLPPGDGHGRRLAVPVAALVLRPVLEVIDEPYQLL